MQAAIKSRHLDKNTVMILSAKHGQSPINPADLTRVPDGPIIDALNSAWNAAGHAGTLVAFAIDDDGWIMWLNDRSQSTADFAKAFLLGHSGMGNDITGAPKAYTNSGLQTVYAGAAAAEFMGVPTGDARVPDVIGIAKVGSVYTGKKAKIAEHDSNNPADRDGSDRRLGRRGRRRGQRQRRRNHPDRADHPSATRPRPARPESGSDRAHPGSAARQLN